MVVAQDESAALRILAGSRLVLDALPRAIAVADLDTTIVAWNHVAERLYGWTGPDVVGRSLYEIVFAATHGDVARAILDKVATGETWSGDIPVVKRDATMTRSPSFVGPLRDEHGDVVGFLCATDDVVSELSMPDEAPDVTEHLVLALAAGELGTWRWHRGTGVVSLDATMEQLFGLAPGTFDGTMERWRSFVHPDDAEATFATLQRAVVDKSSYQLEARIIWPDGSVHWLHGRGQVIVDDTGEVTGTVGCAGDVTARKLLEIEAEDRLREAERIAARERLQRERLEFLAAVNNAALAAEDHRDLMKRVASVAVPHLGDWCSVHFRPESGVDPEREIVHWDPQKLDWARQFMHRYPYDPNAPAGVPKVLRTGLIEFLPEVSDAFLDEVIDAAAHIAPKEELRAVVEGLQLTSVITVPLRTKTAGIIGAMQFVSAESERRYEPDDVMLANAAAGRVAEALYGTWLTEQQRNIATTLQAALLPPRLPVIPGVTVWARHWAAGAASDVGGDFYDVFQIDDRRWAVVIGDICGKGPDAAAVTVIARHTTRAAAKHGADHVEVLEWVNDALHAGNRDRFCTEIYTSLERDDEGWVLTCVSGGHPLPVLVRADGTTTTVGQPGTLLGVLHKIDATPVSVHLQPGDTVVFYTDGVTDVAPPHDLDDDALLQLVTSAVLGSGTVADVVDRLGAAVEAVLPIPQRNDDVALVAVRVEPPSP
jgi:PAS domain S-box-containing protein